MFAENFTSSDETHKSRFCRGTCDRPDPFCEMRKKLPRREGARKRGSGLKVDPGSGTVAPSRRLGRLIDPSPLVHKNYNARVFRGTLLRRTRSKRFFFADHPPTASVISRPMRAFFRARDRSGSESGVCLVGIEVVPLDARIKMTSVVY